MAYYILSEGCLLRGYKKLPFGITYTNPFCNTIFFNKEEYELILDCNGETDIIEEKLSAKQKRIFKELLENEIIHECEKGKKYDADQKYVFYPVEYKNKAQWSVTGRCNYLCKHCFLSSPSYKGEDLSLEKCNYILDQLNECGIHNVSLTGGEPLVYKDLFGLLRSISNHNINITTIYTNGALVNERLLDELESLNLKPMFKVSFDGVGWHDWLRGIDGAEKKALDAIKLLKSRGYFVYINMMLHKKNLKSVPETVKLLGDAGCDFIGLNGMNQSGNWTEHLDDNLTEKEIMDFILDYLPQFYKDGAPLSAKFESFIRYDKETRTISLLLEEESYDNNGNMPACNMLKKNLYISDDGKILPCMTFHGMPIENELDSVFDKPLKDIINDSAYTKYTTVTCGECVEHNEECRDCKYKWICKAGCRALAYQQNNFDYYGIHKMFCCYFKNGYYEKIKELIEQLGKNNS